MISYIEIKQNLNIIRDYIGDAAKCRHADIYLVIATKTIPQETLKMLSKDYDALIFGENRVQELLDKYFVSDKVEWQFIGRLQTNKVKYIIDIVSLIHSVDRLSLAAEIDYRARKSGKIMNVLVELNMGEEQSKGGVSPLDFEDFCSQLSLLPNINVCGIMTVMPNLEDRVKLGELYLQLVSIYDTIKKENYDNFDIKYLSAGMSGDYALALANGSNMVRLGSAIFGARK